MHGNMVIVAAKLREYVRQLKNHFNFIIVKNNYIILGANDIIECEAV